MTFKPNFAYLSRRVVGLEANFLNDEVVRFNLVHVKVMRDLFEIVQENFEIKSQDELSTKLQKVLPGVLTISGNGVLHRKMEGLSNGSLIESFNRFFPHSNPSEFYIQQSFQEGDDSSYISIIRRDQIDSLLFKLLDFKIVSLMFGPFAFSRIISLIESTTFVNDSINLGHYQLSLRSNHIESIGWVEEVETSEKIRLGEEEYDAASIIPYASVLNYYSYGNLIREAEIESVASKRQDFLYHQKFKAVGITLAGSFFVVLLINFFLFNSYFSKSNDLKESLSISSRSIAQLDSLKKELDSHKQVLTSYNFQGMSKTSYYADQIAFTVPGSITLEELNLFPLKKGDAGSEDLLFDDKKILISGYSRASIDLNEWIKQLQQNNWAGNVNILSYNQTVGKDKGKFSIEVELL